jgi:hypothetical protein
MMLYEYPISVEFMNQICFNKEFLWARTLALVLTNCGSAVSGMNCAATPSGNSPPALDK